MIKFMRKHNKKLLAIFTAGLLVVWLGSQALEEMLKRDTSKETAGRAFGQSFDRRDRQNAHMRIEVLSSMGFPWNRPWGMNMSRLPIRPVDELTWFLLDREARRQGIEVTTREVDSLLTAAQMPGTVLERIRDRNGVSIDSIKSFIADFMRIERLGHMAAGAIKVSDVEARHLIRDTGEKVTVRMTVLKASDFAEPNTPPDAAAMEKQFHDLKNDLPGKGGRHGYGYRCPDRIRLEYITTSLTAIENALKVSKDEAMEYWREHRQNYTKQVPVSTAPSSAPSTNAATTASAPTTSSKPTSMEAKIKSFDEAYEQVVADMRRDRAPSIAEKLVRETSQRIMEPWFDIQADPNTGYKKAPVGVDAPDYLSKIAAEVCRRNEMPTDALRVVKPSQWISRSDVAALEGIGKATLEAQPSEEDSPAEFADAAFRVQNLYTLPKERRGSHGLSLFELYTTPLRDRKDGAPNNYYLFRVVAAQKEHTPETIDEVKDLVKRDVIEMAGYQKAADLARKLQAAAAGKGLQEAVQADASLSKKLGDKAVLKPEPFARRRSYGQMALQLGMPFSILWPLEELNVTEERKVGFLPMPTVAEPYVEETERFLEACFQLAPPPSPTTTAASQPTRKVTVVEMPRARQWVVVEFEKIDRVQRGDAQKALAQTQGILQYERVVSFFKEWYDPEQVKKRAGYKPAHDEEGQ